MTQDRIDELEERKEDIKMDDDNYEYTEEAKDEYVERRMDEVRNDPVGFLRDFGMEESIKDFIDEDEFIEGVIKLKPINSASLLMQKLPILLINSFI